MKKVTMIDSHADIREVSVDRYVKYNMNGHDFNLLMYQSKNGKYMTLVKEIYGALYTIPFDGDISSAEPVEELDINSVPDCILPAIRVDRGSRKLKNAIQRLIGSVAEKHCNWYSEPEKYLLPNGEYRFPDSDKDIPEDIAYEGEPTLPVLECDRYIAFEKSDKEPSIIQTFTYKPYRPADMITEPVSENCHIMFDPAPSMDSIVSPEYIREKITNGVFNGYRTEVDSIQISAEVQRGTTAVTSVILPDGKTLPVETLVLPTHHRYNIHFAEDVNKLAEKNEGFGKERFTVSPLLAKDKTPEWLFRQGVAKLRNVKVGTEYVVGESSRKADYIEAAFHRPKQLS